MDHVCRRLQYQFLLSQEIRLSTCAVTVPAAVVWLGCQDGIRWTHDAINGRAITRHDEQELPSLDPVVSKFKLGHHLQLRPAQCTPYWNLPSAHSNTAFHTRLARLLLRATQPERPLDVVFDTCCSQAGLSMMLNGVSEWRLSCSTSVLARVQSGNRPDDGGRKLVL